MAVAPLALHPLRGVIGSEAAHLCWVQVSRALASCCCAPAGQPLITTSALAGADALQQQHAQCSDPRRQIHDSSQHHDLLQRQQHQPTCILHQQRSSSPQSHLLQSQPHSRHDHSTAFTSRAYSSSTAAGTWLPPTRTQPVPSSIAALASVNQALGPLLSQQPQHLQQHRGVKQLRPYAEAPKPLPRFRKPDQGGRMNRMVIRVPPQVQLQLKDQQLLFKGKAGTTSLSLSFLDPTGLVAWQCYTQSAAAASTGPGTGSLILLASPSTRCWRGIQTHINNAIHGVMQGYLVGVTVQGVGYRLEPVADTVIAAAQAARTGGSAAGSSKRRILWEQEAEKTNIAYPHKEPSKAVRMKVGYTRACIFQLPEGVLAFFVKPTLMYLYGIDKALVTNTAAAIRAIRKPNAYTGNGVQLVGEQLKLKQRAGSK